MVTPDVDHKLAAILAADVSGYSRLMETNERVTVATLESYRAVFQESVVRHGGRIVDTAGDSVLAVFPSSIGAVEAAIEIQDELGRRNAPLSEAERMHFRIGVNLGDVIEKADGSIYGSGVNVAARLESLAEPGGICLSNSVHEQVESKINLGFQDMGEHAVKNIARPVRAYGLIAASATNAAGTDKPKSVPRMAATKGRIALATVAIFFLAGLAYWKFSEEPKLKSVDLIRSRPAPVSLAAGPSIAVLPFKNVNGNPEQEYFSDGITEDIITDLSRVDRLFVIARNSSFRYKDEAVDIGKVGRALGVRYLLTGSVRRSGDQVRVSARLVDTTTEGQIWANRFDRDITDVFAVQDDVTREIVTALQIRFNDNQDRPGAQPPTTSVDAYDLFLRARTQKNLATKESNLLAERLFREAVALDAAFAAAYAELSYVLWRNWFYEWSGEPDLLSRAQQEAETAVRVREDSSLAHARLAWILAWANKLERAVEEAKIAVQLDPNFAEGRLTLASVLSMNGQNHEAIIEATKAELLDPYSFLVKFTRGVAYFGAGRYEDAIAAHREALKLNPDFPGSHQFLAATFGLLGRLDEAHVEADAVRRLTGNSIENILRSPVSNFSQRQRLIEGLRRSGFDLPAQQAISD